MTSYVTPKRAAAYKFYVALVDQSNTKLTKANPTIASGDFKVSTDGGAFANLATLPSANPASGRAVMIDLSSGEMTGDNIVVQCVDAAGAEWCDLVLNIQTSARQIDDLAWPTVTGRSLDVTATGGAGIDWSNVEAPTTALALTGTTIAVTQKVDVDTIKTNPVVNAGTVTFPTNATLASTTNITAGTIATVTTVTNQLTAAAIATGVWQDATAGDFTTASSIGKALYVANIVPGAAGGHFIAGTNAATTITGSLTTTFTGSLTGSVASVSGAVGSVTAAVTLTAGERNSVADALLARNIAGGSSSGRIVTDALRFLRNKWSISGTTLTVCAEDDSATAWTATISTDAAALPITGNDLA